MNINIIRILHLHIIKNNKYRSKRTRWLQTTLYKQTTHLKETITYSYYFDRDTSPIPGYRKAYISLLHSLVLIKDCYTNCYKCNLINYIGTKIEFRRWHCIYLGSLFLLSRATNVSISVPVIWCSSNFLLLCKRAVIVSSARMSWPICCCIRPNCFAIYSYRATRMPVKMHITVISKLKQVEIKYLRVCHIVQNHYANLQAEL